ncbi:MAG: flagellar basal body rod protein FlgB [Pseudomonadota bacterium]
MIKDPFANHARALALRAERNEVLATNIANADTPGYKARDFDFRAAMAGARTLQSVSLQATHPGHVESSSSVFDTRTSLAYRIPAQPSVDGNTVETDIEQAQYADNAMGYQASLNFINRKISGLRLAIRGSL